MSGEAEKQALTVEQVPLDALRPDPANPRRMSQAELGALVRSLREWGFVQPVVARREDGTVIGGHQRLVAARKLGYREVPVVYLDVSPEQARLLGLALNRISGEWDEELLGRLLADLQASETLDLSLSGFGEEELAKLLKALDIAEKKERLEDFDIGKALAGAQAGPVTGRGDLWLLGEHRLLCGDATDEGDVARLFAGGEEAALLATDPPYLVDYRGGEHPPSRANRGRATKDKHWDAYVDPETSVAFYREFLRLGLARCRPGVAVYQWHATRRQALVEEAWRACGLLVHQTIVWVKARGVLNRSHYLWRHEPCFYGWVEGEPPARKPPPDATTVWQISQAGEQMGIHPTQKPVELFLRPMEYHTEVGDVVYEPFLGSGTQLIAAERLGRRCFAMELSPAFCDVAVRRWEAFTGQRAGRRRGGEP